MLQVFHGGGGEKKGGEVRLGNGKFKKQSDFLTHSGTLKKREHAANPRHICSWNDSFKNKQKKQVKFHNTKYLGNTGVYVTSDDHPTNQMVWFLSTLLKWAQVSETVSNRFRAGNWVWLQSPCPVHQEEMYFVFNNCGTISWS